MILGKKSSSSSLDTNTLVQIQGQYPNNLAEELKLKISVLMDLYEQHGKSKREPNYLELKLKKKVSAASFYTGFSFDRYVGRPDYEIIVFLSDDDFLSKNFEGMIRRIAHDLLPQRDAPIFDDLLVDYYELLEKKELGPYWEEASGEPKKEKEIEEESDVKKNSHDITMEKTEPKLKTVDENVQEEKFDFDEQFDNFKKDELRDIIHQLQQIINEKTEKINSLSQKIKENENEQLQNIQDIQILEKQLEEQNVLLDDWNLKIEKLNEKNESLNETIMKLTAKTDYQAKELESKSLEIEELTKLLREKDKDAEKHADFDKIKKENEYLTLKLDDLKEFNKELKNEKENTKGENELLLNSIASFKLQLKDLKEKLFSEGGIQDKTSDEMITLKKEIKVLRRERDTYLKIIKEKNLL